MSASLSRPSTRQSTLPHECWKGGHDPSPDTPVPPPTAGDAVVVRRRAGRTDVRVSLAKTRARLRDMAGGFDMLLADLAGGEPGE
jgi:hypothetical protein